MDEIMEYLTAVQLSPGNYVNKFSGLVSFDITRGDCSLSHLRMKRILELDEVTKEIQWNLMCVDRNHTFVSRGHNKLRIPPRCWNVEVPSPTRAFNVPNLCSNSTGGILCTPSGENQSRLDERQMRNPVQYELIHEIELSVAKEL